MATPKKLTLHRLINQESANNPFTRLARELRLRGAPSQHTDELTDAKIVALFSWVSIRDDQMANGHDYDKISNDRVNYMDKVQDLSYTFIRKNLLRASNEIYYLAVECIQSCTSLVSAGEDIDKAFLNELSICYDYGHLVEQIYVTSRVKYLACDLLYLYEDKHRPNYSIRPDHSFIVGHHD